MDDLISRQAAIDALEKIFPANPETSEYTQGITCGAALAIEFVKQLPPAQPETTMSICKNSGVTLWYECDSCKCPVDEKDIYCRLCGRKFKHE